MTKFEDIIKEAKNVRLNADDKALARNALIMYMREMPVRSFNLARFHVIRFASAAFAIVLFGGGISYAAQGALPGEALYPVKVNVTEKVLGWLKVSASSKTAFEMSLAETRLQEAEKL